MVEIDAENASKVVSDFADGGGSWNWEEISLFLRNDCLELFQAIKAPEDHLGHDSIAWLHSPSGVFTVKATYKCWSEDSGGRSSILYKAVWRVKAPLRILHFLWPVNDALLTNQACHRRGMAMNDICRLCGLDAKTMLHNLRGCSVAKGSWMSIDNRFIPNNFFTKSLSDWIEDNIGNKSRSFGGMNWPLYFATICSSLWYHRNLVIFEGENVIDPNLLRKVVLLIREYDRALTKLDRVRKTVPNYLVRRIS